MIRVRPDGAFAVRPAIHWWIGLTIAAAALGFCGFLPGSLMYGHPFLSRLAQWCLDVAPVFAIVCAGIAAYALFKQVDVRRLRQTKNQLDALRNMDWQNFELLVADGFRRLGYEVDNRGWYVPSSRVHISLQKNGERTLVECRQWQVPEVGLGPVRELYSTLASEHADGAVLITSGTFIPEAEAFVRDKPIGLINGSGLLELVSGSQKDSRRDMVSDPPQCPVCERRMIRKKAPRDSSIGRFYWSCSAYPACPGTRLI
jgi:restriction system protein